MKPIRSAFPVQLVLTRLESFLTGPEASFFDVVINTLLRAAYYAHRDDNKGYQDALFDAEMLLRTWAGAGNLREGSQLSADMLECLMARDHILKTVLLCLRRASILVGQMQKESSVAIRSNLHELLVENMATALAVVQEVRRNG